LKNPAMTSTFYLLELGPSAFDVVASSDYADEARILGPLFRRAPIKEHVMGMASTEFIRKYNVVVFKWIWHLFMRLNAFV
jgi:hypothetical protein